MSKVVMKGKITNVVLGHVIGTLHNDDGKTSRRPLWLKETRMTTSSVDCRVNIMHCCISGMGISFWRDKCEQLRVPVLFVFCFISQFISALNSPLRKLISFTA